VGLEHFEDAGYRALYGVLTEALTEPGTGELLAAFPKELRPLVDSLLGDATELTHPEEIYEASVERLLYRPAERRLREIRREMKLADEAQQKELLREQMRIRARLPETEKTRLALVLPWLERYEPSRLEERQGDG
jgi:hypothetical protein